MTNTSHSEPFHEVAFILISKDSSNSLVIFKSFTTDAFYEGPKINKSSKMYTLFLGTGVVPSHAFSPMHSKVAFTAGNMDQSTVIALQELNALQMIVQSANKGQVICASEHCS